MWGTFRLTARLLSLVMLVPAFAPVTLAGASAPQAMHCMRHPAQPEMAAMHCHHGMAKTPESGASFRALDGCCQNHDCCRSLKTSERARPASNLLSNVGLLIERAPVPIFVTRISAELAGQDSTRAPPRS